MLQYEKIDVSEGIHVNKQVHQKNVSFATMFFIDVGFKFEEHVCDNVVIY